MVSRACGREDIYYYRGVWKERGNGRRAQLLKIHCLAPILLFHRAEDTTFEMSFIFRVLFVKTNHEWRCL